jgi:hypothetical protein
MRPDVDQVAMIVPGFTKTCRRQGPDSPAAPYPQNRSKFKRLMGDLHANPESDSAKLVNNPPSLRA